MYAYAVCPFLVNIKVDPQIWRLLATWQTTWQMQWRNTQ